MQKEKGNRVGTSFGRGVSEANREEETGWWDK